MVDQEVVVLVVPAVAVGSAVVLVADSEAPAPVQEALVATTIDLIRTRLTEDSYWIVFKLQF